MSPAQKGVDNAKKREAKEASKLEQEKRKEMGTNVVGNVDRDIFKANIFVEAQRPIADWLLAN